MLLVELAGLIVWWLYLLRRSLQTLRLSASSSAERVALFRDRLEAITARQGDLDDRCWAAEWRLRRALDASAAQTTVTISEVCQCAVLAALDGPLRDREPAAVETEGRALVAEVIREHVERWGASTRTASKPGWRRCSTSPQPTWPPS